jgi:hypothetical protein
MKSELSWRDLSIACIADALIEYAELHPGKIDPKDSDPRAYPGWRNGFSRTARGAKAAESIRQINMFDQ